MDKTQLAALIPWIPALGALVCAGMGTNASLRKFSGWACVASVLASFAFTCALVAGGGLKDGAGFGVTVFDWITVGGLNANMAYWVDPLTCVMLLVVTGIGSLIAIYAVGYMKGDKHVGRFFSAVALFIFAMTTLVMAKNLLVLFLGWEGVGFCSYLLIGYYYGKDSAVAAGKKAFIVNRIGDLGFLLGIFLCWTVFHTLDIPEILAQLGGHAETIKAAAGLLFTLIPFCLMLAAFGKSAQLPLYVWLPDAMAGPTPVSALVHAATMVTSGVYLITRLFPLFHAVPAALTVIAIVGCATALFAATIALCNNDLKGVFAYSTVSQLGYMFLGLGTGHPEASVFHLVTHAFFKALLFLTAGSVMHALAGQLDIRKMGGMWRKMPVTAVLMLIGCLALSGFPLTSGFFSKDEILSGALEGGTLFHQTLFGIGLFTAFLTAFYTFRLWCTVFLGETKYEMGDEHHAEEGHDGHDAHAHEPHEMPWWPMNLPLVALALGALVAGVVFAHPITEAVQTSLGHAGLTEAKEESHGLNPVMLISAATAVLGILTAFLTHAWKRNLSAKAAVAFAPLVRALQGKWFVDELYDFAIVKPLWLFSQVLFVIDTVIIDGLVKVVAAIPGALGRLSREGQTGRLQGHALAMLTGLAALACFLFYAMQAQAH